MCTDMPTHAMKLGIIYIFFKDTTEDTVFLAGDFSFSQSLRVSSC